MKASPPNPGKSKLPIDAWSRSVVDVEIEKVRHSVIPIVGPDKRNRPFLVGSAVALVYRGQKVLVTAEHVLSDSKDIPLAFFGTNGWTRPFGGDFVVSIEHDLAVKRLSQLQTDALSHVPFLTESVLERAAPMGEPFYGSVTGFPASAARRKDKVTLDTEMDVYSNFASEQPDGGIAVFFDKKEGAIGNSGHTNLRDPVGKSGGAIFGFKVDGRRIRAEQAVRLVGIPTRWERESRRIRGSSVAVLIPLLSQVVEQADASEGR